MQSCEIANELNTLARRAYALAAAIDGLEAGAFLSLMGLLPVWK